MNACAVLLADFEVVKSMSNRFHGKQAQLHTSDLLMGLGLLVIVALAAWALSRLTRRGNDQPQHHNPRSLFRELCQAHNIDRGGRALLQKLAKSHDLDPARLFLEPDRWQPEALDPALASYQDECRALYEQLFAQPEEPAAAEPAPTESAPAEEPATAAS
ncbi:MAG TPA: hypothetical protein VHV55_09430 [Pirellulales bacterium]|jgi:hypothetical protein|nr:hypothetical protein [Pirellulales bacterium]